jgi:hypothetical protein
MITTATNSASALTNLRKVRMSLQKQEQNYIQKEFASVLSTIIGLLNEHQLTLEDVETAMSSKMHKVPRKSKKKATQADANGVVSSGTSVADSVNVKPTTQTRPSIVGPVAVSASSSTPAPANSSKSN